MQITYYSRTLSIILYRGVVHRCFFLRGLKMNSEYSNVLLHTSIIYWVASAFCLYIGIRLFFGIGEDFKIKFKKNTSEILRKIISYPIKPLSVLLIVSSIYLSYSCTTDYLTGDIREGEYVISDIQINNRNITDAIFAKDHVMFRSPRQFRNMFQIGKRYKVKYFYHTHLVVEIEKLNE